MPAIWAVVVLVVVSICGFALYGSKIEKFIVDVGEEAGALADRVLNPGVLVLAVVGLFIIYGGLRRGGAT